MTAKHMTEVQSVNLLRNALAAAGHEMAKDGDHWPVIKATAFSIMKDYEDWEIAQNTLAEAKKHYGDMIGELQAMTDKCAPESRSTINAAITELLELYQACFTPVDLGQVYVPDDKIPAHVKRAEAIIKTLEDANG